ncbi:MAG: immunity 49 family protein [Chitinophagaceae bacterium]|nr:immunity 49 family protein [Chitinophagaceae bacterium]
MEFKDLPKEERLTEVIKSIIANYSKLKVSLSEGRTSEAYITPAMWYDHEMFALNSCFLDKEINTAKFHFNRCGLLDEFNIKKYDDRCLDYGINHISYALLSDNFKLINRYANLKHSKHEEMLQNGMAAPVYAIQCLLTEDWNEFDRAMEIVKTKTVKKYKLMPDDQFYEAVATKNKQKCEEILAELLTTKMHKKRNKHNGLTGEFTSHPAIGYAKLAWIKGIEAEVNSPFIPKELLPVNPLESYEAEIKNFDFDRWIESNK